MAQSSSTNPITFYHTGQAYDIFTNTVGGLNVSCDLGNGQPYQANTEAIFQGTKHLIPGTKVDYATKQIVNRSINHTTFQTLITSQPGKMQQQLGEGSHSVYDLPFNGGHPSSYTRKDFSGVAVGTGLDNSQLSIKERMMYELIRMKATQNPEVMKTLLSTGDAPLIENTKLADYDDPFWGNGKSLQGRNALGRLWEQLRTDLNHELQTTGQVQVRTGFSRDLYNALGLDKQILPGQSHPIPYQGQETDPSRVITKGDLDRLPVITTARDITNFRGTGPAAVVGTHGAYQQATRSTQASATANPFSSPNSAHSRAAGALKTLSPGLTTFDVAEDAGKPGQEKYVLKLRFTDQQAAMQFQSNANSRYNAHVGNPQANTIFIAEDKAQTLLNALGTGVQGRTRREPIIEAIKGEAGIGNKAITTSTIPQPPQQYQQPYPQQSPQQYQQQYQQPAQQWPQQYQQPTQQWPQYTQHQYQQFYPQPQQHQQPTQQWSQPQSQQFYPQQQQQAPSTAFRGSHIFQDAANALSSALQDVKSALNNAIEDLKARFPSMQDYFIRKEVGHTGTKEVMVDVHFPSHDAERRDTHGTFPHNNTIKNGIFITTYSQEDIDKIIGPGKCQELIRISQPTRMSQEIRDTKSASVPTTPTPSSYRDSSPPPIPPRRRTNSGPTPHPQGSGRSI